MLIFLRMSSVTKSLKHLQLEATQPTTQTEETVGYKGELATEYFSGTSLVLGDTCVTGQHSQSTDRIFPPFV